jgi:TldD protein
MKSTDTNLNVLSIAQDVLLTPFGLDELQLRKTLDSMCAHRIDYADLYFQFNKNESWMLEEGIVKTGSFCIDQGVGVRAISGDKTAFSYSDEISEHALSDAAMATRTIARQGSEDKIPINSFQKNNYNPLYLPIDPLVSLDSTQKVKLLERVEALARSKDQRVVQVMAGLSAEYNIVLVARSDGLISSDIRPLVRLSVTVIVEQNGRRETGSSSGGGRYCYDYFSDALIEQYVSEAVASALVNLDSRSAPAGLMNVVLGPGWPGILLHEAIGHGLEGDFNRKGSSAFSGRIGERVAAKGVTVLDDGTIHNRRGSLTIDDEGNPSQCTTLIEDGILKGYIQDTMNARLMKMPITGNARRESFAHLPMPRMTNTYMLGGDMNPEEILASVGNGLYAVNFSSGQVDITSGKFVFSASEAYMIENGKITYPVKGATLIGNGPDILNRVSMIGNDMKLDPGVGVCGKEGQSVPVGVGQPTLLVESMTIGGTV